MCFPLRARDGGVLSRRGHTEGTLMSLARLAGLKPSGVLCELTNSDGSIASGIQVWRMQKHTSLQLLLLRELVQYRLAHHI